MDNEELSMWLSKPEVQEKLAPIKRLQGVLLELLLVIDKVCSENGLSYCLFYGTLLGALRHGGFIPWDDDADIVMPRGDYEKLLHLPATTWPNGYFLQSPYSDKYSRFAFAKLRKNGTICTCDDHAHIKMHQGIFVDIFPLDKATGRRIKYLWRIPRVFERLAALSCVRLPNRYKWLSVAHKMWMWCFSPSFFSRIGNFIARNLNENGKIMLDTFAPGRSKAISRGFSESLLFPTQKTAFEGFEFHIPKEPEQLLSQLYGDWKCLPTEDKRCPIHSEGGMIDFGCAADKFCLPAKMVQ